jgi:hypothetical protein
VISAFAEFVLAAVHFCTDWAIARPHRMVDESSWLLLAKTALPLSQATLVAAWAALSRVRSYLRIPLAFLTFAWLWSVECRILGFLNKDYLSASHALSLVVQGILVLLVLSSWRGVNWLLHSRMQKSRSCVQFSIGFLLCWTTAIALLLGLGKYELQELGWTVEFIRGKMFYAGAGVGAFDAILGLLVFAAFFGRKLRWLKMILAAIFITLLCYYQRYVLEYLFGFDGKVSTFEWSVQAGYQITYLLATLIPVSIVGCLTQKQSVGIEELHSIQMEKIHQEQIS